MAEEMEKKEIGDANETQVAEEAVILDSDKIKEYLEKLKDWQLSQDEKSISRSFNFDTFREAMEFVNHVADFSEKTKHYPKTIIITFPQVTIDLASKGAEGLSEQDFVLAQEIDDIASWKIRFEHWLANPQVFIAFLVILLLVLLWLRFR